MATLYAFIAPAELASRHDPVRVLRTATSRADLVANANYDPDRVSFWSLDDVVDVEQPPVSVTNLKTGGAEPACVCKMETQ